MEAQEQDGPVCFTLFLIYDFSFILFAALKVFHDFVSCLNLIGWLKLDLPELAQGWD